MPNHQRGNGVSAYICSLNRRVEATSQSVFAKPDLRERFAAWYAALPEISRYRAFAMTELEIALSTQGKYLGPVLLALGWQRRRKWTGSGEYSRYWLPPEHPKQSLLD